MTGLDGDALADYGQMMSAICAEMRAHGLNTVTVAERVGVHPVTATKWLGSRLTPSLKHVLELAAVVGLAVSRHRR